MQKGKATKNSGNQSSPEFIPIFSGGAEGQMHYGASKLIFQKAEELRKFPTHEEDIVWGYLSKNKLGLKFRRQHPIWNYIADFYCHSLKLVVEIDGGIHNREDVKTNDVIRQADIESLGIHIIRFTNQEVRHNMQSLINSLLDKMNELKNSELQSPPLGAGGHAMIFAAGLGTRFKPWTDSHPKALAIVNGKSLLQRNIEYLQQYGVNNVVVNVHHFADQILSAIKENNGWGSNIIISDETDEVLETGGGLLKAKELLAGNEPFFTLNADFLTDLNLDDLLAFHKEKKGLISFGITTRKSSRNFLFDEDNRLCGWMNTATGEKRIAIDKPDLTPMAYSCVVIFEPVIFDLIPQRGKFSLVDTYLSLAAQYPIYGYDHTGDKLVDVGKPESVAVAESLFE
jgi:very-short-patch-repair endonuclease/dTDP-glucose pyrophosphorylase